MRRSERTYAAAHTVAIEKTSYRVDGNHLQRFVFCEVGKNRRSAARQHRFAGARRPNEQDVVAACCRNFQGAFCRLLADHFREIGIVAVPMRNGLGNAR